MANKKYIKCIKYINPNKFPFYIENKGNTTAEVMIHKNSTDAYSIEVYKSIDMITWSSLGRTSDIINISINPSEKIYLMSSSVGAWSKGILYGSDVIQINSGKCSVGGNIMSLLYGTNFMDKSFSEPYNFCNLFQFSNGLIDASDLVLPNSIRNQSYACMFLNCINMLRGPRLLPASSLASKCYYQMFQGCTSLIKAPRILAKILSTESCLSMFSGCTSLNSVTSYADDISATNCLSNWLENVASSGTFHNLGSATYPTNSPSGIPSGWTELHD